MAITPQFWRVAVIGAGILGAAIAWQLGPAGRAGYPDGPGPAGTRGIEP